MAWINRRIWWAALLGGLLVVAACQGEKEKFPPPQPYETSSSGVGGGGAAGSGTGGKPTWSGNLCECAFEYTFNDACGACVNKARTDAAACKTASEQCADDPSGGCSELLTCASLCYDVDGGAPGPAQAACVQSCYEPFPKDSAHQLFNLLLGCICTRCASECAPSQTIACPGGGGSGGTGGGTSSSSTGPGGSGGTGGGTSSSSTGGGGSGGTGGGTSSSSTGGGGSGGTGGGTSSSSTGP